MPAALTQLLTVLAVGVVCLFCGMLVGVAVMMPKPYRGGPGPEPEPDVPMAPQFEPEVRRRESAE